MMEDGAVSSPPPPPQVHALGLGHAEIRVGHAIITPTSDRLFALTFHLCLRAGEYITRDELVALFWSDAPPTKARHSLRQMLYRLRQMGLPLLDAGDAVHLPEAAVSCDVREVLQDGWELDAPAEMVRAGGERIIGGPLDVSEDYRDWYDATEARVRSQVRRAALRHLSAARREGRWRDLEGWALQVLRHDALNEEATLALAESMVMQGSKARALELLDRYLGELGEKADRIGLPAKVLRKRIVGGGAGTEATPRTRNHIVGRDAELRHALGFLERPIEEGGPRYFLIQGAAGSGKSRLAAEIADAATLRGFAVMYAPIPPSDSATQFSGVQSLAEQLIKAPGCAAISPQEMHLLLSIGKEESSLRFGGLPHPAAKGDSSITNALSNALAAVSEETRTLLVLEDVHHLSEPDGSIVWRAATSADSSRLRILLTTRTTETPALADWSKAQRSSLAVLPLAALHTASALELASSLLANPKNHDIDIATRIATASAGNPLFIHALAAHVKAGGSLASLPDSLEISISAALRGLPDQALLVAESIKCLGPFATLLKVREETGAAPLEYERLLSQLEYEGAIHLDSQGVLRIHECWASVLDSQRPRTALAHRRLRAAEYLIASGGEHIDPEASMHAAGLFHKAGDAHRAFTALLAAGDALYDRGLTERALAAFDGAAATATQPLERATALLRTSLCKQSTGDVAGSYDTALVGLNLARECPPDPSGTQLLLAAQAADTAWRTGRTFDHFLTSIVAQLADGRISLESRHHAAFFSLRILFNDRQSALLEDLIHNIELLSRANTPTVFGDLALLVLAAERGDVTTVMQIDGRLTGLLERSAPAFVHALALRYLSQALRWTGQYRRAMAVCSQAAIITQVHRLANEASILAVQASFLHLDLDDLAQATTLFNEARTLSASLGPSAERSIALWHLEARLHVQKGKFRDAYDLLLAHITDIESDALLKRRCAAAALLAYASVKTGDSRTADYMLKLALPVFESEPPSLQLDFPLELFGRTLSELKRTDEFRLLTGAYLARRSSKFPVPLAPALSLLKSLHSPIA